MRILFTCNFLNGGTGSETFTGTLVRELKKLGHDVTLYTHNDGWYANELREEGFECWYNPNKPEYKLPHTNFDIVHFQHNETVHRIYNQVKHVKKKIFMSHGILPALEQAPVHDRFPMDIYVGCSEETRDNCLGRAFNKQFDARDAIMTKTGIIRNLIDTERFNLPSDINEELKNVLIISNYMGRKPEYIKLVEECCTELNLNLEIIGDAGKRVPDTRPYIEKADLCIALGRCAMESMSMGRNLIVFDYQGLEGFVSYDNYFDIRKKNFSGRVNNNLNPTKEQLMHCFKQYSKDMGLINRQLILRYHGSKQVAKQAETEIYLR